MKKMREMIAEEMERRELDLSELSNKELALLSIACELNRLNDGLFDYEGACEIGALNYISERLYNISETMGGEN